MPGKSASVCFIVVYFGRLPEWLPYYLLTCSVNPKFDWLIFSNNVPNIDLPRNVRIQKLEPSELEVLVSKALDSPFRYLHGYKLCDLKPAYGNIFASHLTNYDFWGYTDLDLTYGRIDYFVTADTLRHFDVITASDTIVVGHFTLLRNTAQLTNLYRTCDNYLETLKSDECESFDEKDFAHAIHRAIGRGEIRLKQDSIQVDDCSIWWSGRSRFLILWWNGHLWDIFRLREVSYFHFIQSKYKPKSEFNYIPVKRDVRCFYCCSNGIRPIRSLREAILFFLTFLSTLAFTLRWYLKITMKMMVPAGSRRWLRKISTRPETTEQ